MTTPQSSSKGSAFGSPRAVSLVALVLAATFLHAQGVMAKTLVVTKGVNCYPQVTGTPYNTIQAAVDAMPIAILATNTVVVCAGTYPEQIKITKNITITGVLRDGTDPVAMDGNSNEATIVPPAGGLVVDPNFLGNVAAQVSAQNITDLNLINIGIDGTGIGCPMGATGPMPTAGLALYNVGLVGTGHKATISRTVVHNQIGYCGTGRSYTGDGIVAENSWFTLDSNSLSNVDLNLVHQLGGVSKITSNFLNYGWHGILLSNVSETYGLTLTGSTISSNTLTTFSDGIHLDGSSHVLVSQNTIAGWSSAAIWVDNNSSDNDIVSNKIIDAGYGIYLTNGSARTNVKSNTIIRSVLAAIVNAYSHGGNVITGNLINQSPIGIFGLNALPDDVVNPNTFYNTKVLTTSGSVLP